MTQYERDELKRLEVEATPRPWEHTGRGGNNCLDTPRGCTMCDEQYYPWAPDSNDFAFIAAARNAVPDLLAENRRIRELLQSAYEHLEAGYPTAAEEMIESFLADHP